MSFIFGGNTGRTAADAKRMRQRAMLDQAAMARSRVRKPIDIIDPLAYMLAGKIRDNRASKIETEARAAQQAYMGKLINALLPGEGGGGGSYSGGGGGGSYSGASPSAGASAARQPGIAPSMAAGTVAGALAGLSTPKAASAAPKAAAPGATAVAGLTPSAAAQKAEGAARLAGPIAGAPAQLASRSIAPLPSHAAAANVAAFPATMGHAKAGAASEREGHQVDWSKFSAAPPAKPGPVAPAAPPEVLATAPRLDAFMAGESPPLSERSRTDGDTTTTGQSIANALIGAGRAAIQMRPSDALLELGKPGFSSPPTLPGAPNQDPALILPDSATSQAPIAASIPPRLTANNRDLPPGAPGAPGAMSTPPRVGVTPGAPGAPKVVDALSGRTTQQDTPLPVKAAAPTATPRVTAAAAPPPAQPASNPNLPVRSNRPQYDLFSRHYQGEFMKRYSRADEDRIAANAISQKELKARGIELSKYYTLNEISGNHGRAIIAAPRALRGLDMMTERFGEKLPIMSGFRTRKQVPHGSYRHNEGWAFDFNMRGWSDEKKRRLITAAREAGATSLGYGVGRKSSMLHIDWSPKTVDQVGRGGRGGSLWGYGGRPPGWVEKVWRNTKALKPGENPAPTGPDAIAQALGSGPTPATRSVGGAATAAPSYGASPQGGRRRQLAELLLNAPPGAFDNMSRPQQMIIGALMQDALKGGGSPELIYRNLGNDIAVIDKRSGKLVNRIPANAAGGGVGGAGGARGVGGAGGPKLTFKNLGGQIVALHPTTGEVVNRIAGQPGSGKPPTEGQRTARGLHSVAKRELDYLIKLTVGDVGPGEGHKITNPDLWTGKFKNGQGNVESALGLLSNNFMSNNFVNYEQSMQRLLDVVLRAYSGATVTKDDIETAFKGYKFNASDSAHQRMRKITGLIAYVDSLAEKAALEKSAPGITGSTSSLIQAFRGQ